MREGRYLLVIAVILSMVWSLMWAGIVIGQSSAGESITITEPTDNGTVSQYGESIVFGTTTSVEENYIPVVFIRDPLNQWWPWLTVRPTGNQRREWALRNVQFGVKEDVGQIFKIQVIRVSTLDIDNGITISVPKRGSTTVFIEAGTPIKNSTMVVLRKKLPIVSNVVTVHRR